MKLKLSLFLAIACLSLVGCRSLGDPANWRPMARIDFVNDAPGTTMVVVDDQFHSRGPSFGYHDSGFVPIVLDSQLHANVNCHLEVTDENGNTELVPYSAQFYLGNGGFYGGTIFVRTGRHRSHYALVVNTNSS